MGSFDIFLLKYGSNKAQAAINNVDASLKWGSWLTVADAGCFAFGFVRRHVPFSVFKPAMLIAKCGAREALPAYLRQQSSAVVPVPGLSTERIPVLLSVKSPQRSLA